MAHIEDLVAKYLAGEADLEEKKAVELWREGNKAAFAEYESLFKAGSAVLHRSYDAKAALALQSSSRKSVISPKVLLRVAAALVLLIGIFYLISPFQSELLVSQLVVTTDKHQMELPDGTQVLLKKGAILEFPEEFSKKSREVSLVGDAFFDITKDASRPFIIHHPAGDIEVLGTSFDVASDSTDVLVAVITGKVKLTSNLDGGQVVLDPGFSGEIRNGALRKFNTNFNNENAWRTGAFVFDDTPLVSVIKDIDDYFPQKITLETEGLDCQLTASFSHPRLSDILQVLRLTCNVDIDESEKTVVVSAISQ